MAVYVSLLRAHMTHCAIWSTTWKQLNDYMMNENTVAQHCSTTLSWQSAKQLQYLLKMITRDMINRSQADKHGVYLHSKAEMCDCPCSTFSLPANNYRQPSSILSIWTSTFNLKLAVYHTQSPSNMCWVQKTFASDFYQLDNCGTLRRMHTHTYARTHAVTQVDAALILQTEMNRGGQ